MKQPPAKFRETLWFKKGDLDALQAQAADGESVGAVDLLPIEDRYLEDGSLSHRDRADYSIRTGTTECLPLIGDHVAAATDDLPAGVLVRELKGRRVVAALGASLAIAGALLAVYFV